MRRITKNVVRIACLDEVGSGFIYLPKEENEVYVFTAKHCIYGEYDDNDAVLTDIKIRFIDHDENIILDYEVQATDKLISGKSVEDEDISLIIIKRAHLQKLDFEALTQLTLFSLSDRETSCFITGFPKVVNSQFQMTLYQCQFMPDKKQANQFQVESVDITTAAFNSDELIDGYSGSGIFVQLGHEYFVCGIVSEYKEATKRFYCINFQDINRELKSHGLPELPIIEIETRPNILDNIQRLKGETDNVLQRIKDTSQIGNIHLSRTTASEELYRQISNHQLTIVAGRAGMGKSVLTEKVLQSFTDFSIIALRGEDLDHSSISAVFKEKEIDIAFVDLLNSKAYQAQKILLLDSIEKLLENKYTDTILDFFHLLKNRNDIKIVLTCRTYAVERLRLKYLKQFHAYTTIYEVPVLDDDELQQVSSTYSHILPLLDKDKLKAIIEIPFNLNLAVLANNTTFIDNTIDNEIDFKHLMWREVIEGAFKNQRDVQRGNTLKAIALKRAKQLTPYVKVKQLELNILQALVRDGILIQRNRTNLPEYMPAHDIYEDWALTIYIEEVFEDWQEKEEETNTFFSEIDGFPALGRAYRIWISDKLQVIDYDIEEFIQSILNNSQNQPYWKDETLIAILQSNYCKNFLVTNKSLLIENDYHLFKRSLLLLQVACQVPNMRRIRLAGEKVNTIYKNYFLVPKGDSWINVIDYIYDHLDELHHQLPLIMPVLLQWQKILKGNLSLPKNSFKVAKIVLKYLELYKTKYSSFINGSEHNDFIKKGLELVFRLAIVVPKEVKEIITKALSLPKKQQNTREHRFYRLVTEYCLSWEYSGEICLLYPELVIALAKKNWYYYEPTEEEIKKARQENPNSLIYRLPSHKEFEEKFGVVRSSKMDYFPSGAFQTFIFHMLMYNTSYALEFIIDLFKHSIEAFKKSDLFLDSVLGSRPDDRVVVKIKLNNGDVVEQFGSASLWCMFRGTHFSTPNLLQSALMALEEWFLKYTKRLESKKDEREIGEKVINEAFFFLLKESKSVSTTAVLVSIASAYPQIFGKNILPLFRVQKFYEWDVIRFSKEHSALAISDRKNPIAQRLRHESNQLSHRKIYLERLVIQLSLNGMAQDIATILDDFYAENPTNNNWKLSLNRMDFFRKHKVSPHGENQILIEVDIDEELQPIVEQAEKEQKQREPIFTASSWARNIFEDKKVTDINLLTWREHYKSLLNISFNKQEVIFRQPGTLAYVGIRYFYEKLSQEERHWCFKTVVQIIELNISKNFQRSLSFTHNLMDNNPSMESLPFIIKKYNGDNHFYAKELLFGLILYYEDGNLKHDRVTKMRNSIWKHCPDFATACIAGTIQYATIFDIRTKLAPYYPLSKEEKIKLTQQYKTLQEKLFEDVINQKIQLQVDNIKFDTHSAWKLRDAFSLINPDTKNPLFQKLMLELLVLIQNRLSLSIKDEYHYSGEDEKLPSQITVEFSEVLALFLLHQPIHISKKIFEVLLTKIYDTDTDKPYHQREKMLEFADNCLKHLIYKVDSNHQLISNFNFLWEIFFKKLKQSPVQYFSEIILLSHNYWNIAYSNWKPMEGKKTFYKEAIIFLQNLPATLQLISGIGYTELLPDGIKWTADILKNSKQGLEIPQNYSNAEKLIQKIYDDKTMRDMVKASPTLRKSYIYLLDELINYNSTVAFLIRDSFITLKS